MEVKQRKKDSSQCVIYHAHRVSDNKCWGESGSYEQWHIILAVWPFLSSSTEADMFILKMLCCSGMYHSFCLSPSLATCTWFCNTSYSLVFIICDEWLISTVQWQIQHGAFSVLNSDHEFPWNGNKMHLVAFFLKFGLGLHFSLCSIRFSLFCF